MRLETTLAVVALSLSPALAMDCGKAAAPIEKAICADPQLTAQDAALGRRYFAALKRLTGPRHDLLLDDQRAWLAERASTCADASDGIAACARKQTKQRLQQISACYAGATPDPAGGNVLCSVEVHGACPQSSISLAAGLWAYPALVAKLTKQTIDRARDDVTNAAELCAPESDKNPGSPDQNQFSVSITIEGAGEHWVAVRTFEDGNSRGAAHPQYAEDVATYDAATGEVLPIVKLVPALKSDAKAAEAFWAAAEAVAADNDSLPDAGVGRDDISGRSEDAAHHPVPDAWVIDEHGALKVFYHYFSLGHGSVASAVVEPAVFKKWLAPGYGSWFAKRR